MKRIIKDIKKQVRFKYSRVMVYMPNQTMIDCVTELLLKEMWVVKRKGNILELKNGSMILFATNEVEMRSHAFNVILCYNSSAFVWDLSSRLLSDERKGWFGIKVANKLIIKM